MSIDLVGKDICKSCLNHSTAKMMYSFSKAERFPDPKNLPKKVLEKREKDEEKIRNYFKSIGKEAMLNVGINLPDTKSKRATTFGYGKKLDFTEQAIKKNGIKRKKGDEEGADNKKTSEEIEVIHSDFNTEAKGPFKYTFGMGREMPRAPKKNYDLYKTPGLYDVRRKFGSEGPKFTFRGGKKPPTEEELKKEREEIKQKIKEMEGENKDKKNKIALDESPSPVAYEPKLFINPKGNFVYSKFRNVSSVAKSTSKRFPYEVTADEKKNTAQSQEQVQPTPSTPDKNKKEDQMKSLLGTLAQSKYRSYNPMKIGSAKRFEDHKTNAKYPENPGPGTYKPFSEFGVYGIDCYNENKQAQDTVEVGKTASYKEKEESE